MERYFLVSFLVVSCFSCLCQSIVLKVDRAEITPTSPYLHRFENVTQVSFHVDTSKPCNLTLYQGTDFDSKIIVDFVSGCYLCDVGITPSFVFETTNFWVLVETEHNVLIDYIYDYDNTVASSYIGAIFLGCMALLVTIMVAFSCTLAVKTFYRTNKVKQMPWDDSIMEEVQDYDDMSALLGHQQVSIVCSHCKTINFVEISQRAILTNV